MPHAPLTRRAALAVAALATTSACGLRLERDAPIPGPTAEPAPDSTPLEEVRRHLVATMEAASRETHHVAEASAAQTAHRTQIKRLDATLAGIGASALPSVSATSVPSANASSSSSSTPHSPSSTGGATSTSSGASTSTTPSPTSWTRAEAGWADAATCAALQKVSTTSRPLAVAIAARGIAALPAGLDASWSPTATLRPAAGLLEASEMTIHALEWCAAHTPFDERTTISERVSALYAVRSLIEQTSPQAARSASSVPRRYDSLGAARSDAAEAAASMLSACARAATTTRSVDDVNGLLLAWASAARAAQFAGATISPLPGLAA